MHTIMLATRYACFCSGPKETSASDRTAYVPWAVRTNGAPDCRESFAANGAYGSTKQWMMSGINSRSRSTRDRTKGLRIRIRAIRLNAIGSGSTSICGASTAGFVALQNTNTSSPCALSADITSSEYRPHPDRSSRFSTKQTIFIAKTPCLLDCIYGSQSIHRSQPNQQDHVDNVENNTPTALPAGLSRLLIAGEDLDSMHPAHENTQHAGLARGSARLTRVGGD